MIFNKFHFMWMLLFVSFCFSEPFGTLQSQYREQDLVTLSSKEGSISQEVLNFSDRDTLKQSFTIEPQDPLAREVLLQYIFYSTYFWAGTGAKLTLAIYEGDIDAQGALLFTKKFETTNPDIECGMTYPSGAQYFRLSDSLGALDTLDTTSSTFDSEGLVLTVGKQYTFAIIADSIAERSYGFYTATDSYSSGQSSEEGKDIWFKMAGKVDSDMNSAIVFEKHNTNQLFFDTYSYHFPTKLVGVGTTEHIIISHPTVNSFTYHVEDPSIVSLQDEGTSLALEGKTEGDTRVFITDGDDTLSILFVSVKERRRIDVSLSYVKYPGELDHPMMSAFEDITKEITNTYDSINVTVHFVDKGIYEWDWDLNGDSSSYTADYKETKSPVDSGVLTEMDKYFSNLYLIRDEKSDTSIKTGQNGGGSSMGMGSDDFPRAAYKRIHLNQTIQGISSTLGHELAHNLGVSHYSQMNSMYYPTPNPELNIMKTGRQAENIYSFQWQQIHQTIQECYDNGEIYEDKTAINTHSVTPLRQTIHVVHKNNTLFLSNLPEGKSRLRLYDLKGRLLLQQLVTEATTSLILPNTLGTQIVTTSIDHAGKAILSGKKILIGQ